MILPSKFVFSMLKTKQIILKNSSCFCSFQLLLYFYFTQCPNQKPFTICFILLTKVLSSLPVFSSSSFSFSSYNTHVHSLSFSLSFLATFLGNLSTGLCMSLFLIMLSLSLSGHLLSCMLRLLYKLLIICLKASTFGLPHNP